MLVYRVESKNKTGAYGIDRPGSEAQRVSFGAHPEHHPMPYEDGIKDIPRHYHFGFASMEQLEKWWPRKNWKTFAEWNKDHEDDPMGLSIYDVSPEYVDIGKRQLIFNLGEAELIEHTTFVVKELCPA